MNLILAILAIYLYAVGLMAIFAMMALAVDRHSGGGDVAGRRADRLRVRPAADEAEGARSEWQPIETAPKDSGQRILVTGGYTFDNWDVYIVHWGMFPIGRYNRETCCVETVREWEWRLDGDMQSVAHPTHWMPLPRAPEPAP